MSARKGGLGRGLDALIPQSNIPSDIKTSTGQVVADRNEIDVNQILPNPKQPRTVFDEEQLAELALSIKEVGLLQPPVVRSIGNGKYQLIMGERRYRAAKLAGLKSIPVIIRQTNDDQLLKEALIENIHRSQLNPLEEGAAYQQLLNDLTAGRVQLSTDSSSPGQYPVYGTYLHSGNYKTQTFTELYFPKNAEYRRKTHIKQGKTGEVAIDLTQHVPCSMGCPACADFTYEYLGGKTADGLDRYSQEAMPRMVVHNTHLYVQAANEINQMVDSHVELLETVIPRDLYDVILSLHEMFADPDNAMRVYETYIKTYKKFGGDSISTTDANKFNEFFKF